MPASFDFYQIITIIIATLALIFTSVMFYVTRKKDTHVDALENAEEKGKYIEKIETLEEQYDKCSHRLESLTIHMAELARDIDILKDSNKRRKRYGHE